MVHGSFRYTTAGDIRAGGGTVEPAPEFKFGGKDYPFYGGYLGWGP